MSNNPRPKLNVSALNLNRVTADTKFYVDYEWWDKSDLDLKTYLYSRLDIEEGSLDPTVDEVDIIHPDSGEVRRVDGFQFVLQTYFNRLPDDFLQRTSLVDAVFSVLLANANEPMSANEIAAKVERTPDVILRTIGGPKIYQGIRPVLD